MMGGWRRIIVAVALTMPLLAAAQVVNTFTQTQTGSNLRPLGFPVPVPIASLAPIDGFRDYASLHARLQSLALQSPEVAAHQVGSTHAGRSIWAYAISTAALIDREGRAKPAFFINATTHAREWGVPEIATGLVERMVDGANDSALVRYLLDNTRLVIIPVQNIDGFLQTQRFPTQAAVGRDPRFPGNWPRDGRMRRKNMPGVDEVLTSFGDHLLGVDLNRNHPPFWGTVTNGGQLTNPSDLTYRGLGPQSEPEVQALLTAANLAPVSRIRLGIDAHAHQKVFFSANTGRTRLNAIQSRLLTVVAAHHASVPTAAGQPNGRFYSDVPDPPNSGIGVAAEYFAYQWLVPAWTLEIEPGELAAQEYGGTADSHGGFVLPASQVRRVREAWSESHLMAFYFMAGPPHLARVRVRDGATGQLLVEQRWEYRPASLDRQLVTERFAALRAGRQVRVELAFSKPMRHRVNGVVAELPGVSVPLLPQVWMDRAGQRTQLATASGEWQADGWRYRDDTFDFPMTLPDQPEAFRIEVDVADMVGLRLDANPTSPVDWTAGAWSGWDASLAGDADPDSGGVDRTRSFQVEAIPPAQLPRIATAPSGTLGEGDVVRLLLTLDEPALDIIEVHAEDPLITAIRPVVSPPPPAAAVVRWQAGESGPRELWVQAPDNASVEGDSVWQAILALRTAGSLSEFARIDFRLLDNDADGQIVTNLPRVDLGVACCERSDLVGTIIAQRAQLDRQLELVLHADGRYAGGISGSSLVPMEIVGNVVFHGNAAALNVPAHAPPAPLFRVARDASLELDRLTFTTDGPLQTSEPTAQLLPLLVDSSGSARISRSEIAGFSGSGVNRSLFGGSGAVRVERTSIRGLTAIAPLQSSGSLQLESSSLIRNRSSTHLLAGSAPSAGSWNSVLLNSSVGPRFQALAESGTLRLTGNLIQANSGDPPSGFSAVDCGVGVESGGFNLHSGSPCDVLTAEGDQRELNLGYAGPLPLSEPWFAPAGAAIDYGGTCGPVDQRGAPRPQTLVSEAEPVCDVGAIELGVNPYRGIWQPARSGHGVDLQTAGNQLLLAWYTYDDDGQPTAYQAVAALTGPRWRAELQRSRRDPQTGTVLPPVRVGEVGIDFADDANATLRWRFDARGVDGSESIRASLFAPGEPRVEVTGLWFPPADSGYGATVTRRGEVTAIGLYYYDALGALRWALGTGRGESADDIEMLSFTGFCPDCDAAAMPVQSQPAGRVLYHFLTPRRARIDTDLTYPGTAGGQWLRERAEFVPLNDPVDNRAAAALTGQ